MMALNVFPRTQIVYSLRHSSFKNQISKVKLYKTFYKMNPIPKTLQSCPRQLRNIFSILAVKNFTSNPFFCHSSFKSFGGIIWCNYESVSFDTKPGYVRKTMMPTHM